VVSRAGARDEAIRFITGLPGEKPIDSREEHRGLHYHSMAADKGGRHMEPFIIDIEPDSEQAKKPHEGEEFIYVLSGKLKIDYGTTEYTLDAGDSIYYDCIVPHSVVSADDKPVKILAVIYTPA
jgi:quercetin dioxygenase-like cupin family protein